MKHKRNKKENKKRKTIKNRLKYLHAKSFLKNESGISPIISILLILSIFIIFLGVISIEVVPKIINQEEKTESESLKISVIEFREKIESLGGNLELKKEIESENEKVIWKTNVTDFNSVAIWSPKINSDQNKGFLTFLLPLKYNRVSLKRIESVNYPVYLKIYGELLNSEEEIKKEHIIKAGENIFIISNENYYYPDQVNVLDCFVSTATYQSDGNIFTANPMIYSGFTEKIPVINIKTYDYESKPKYSTISSDFSAVLNVKYIENYIFLTNRIIIEFPENQKIKLSPTELYFKKMIETPEENERIKVKRIGKQKYEISIYENKYEKEIENIKSDEFLVNLNIIYTSFRF